MPTPPLSDIEKEIFQFLRGDLSTAEFEQWIYNNTPELEPLFGRDLFLDLISLNYRDERATESLKLTLKVWFNVRYPHSIPDIEEDLERGIVRINSHEIVGFVSEMSCPVCNTSLVHHEIYDSFFCPFCNLWLEHHPICRDPACPYCSLKRPKRPLR